MPARPYSDSWNPVPLGAAATSAPPGRKSLPIAFAGKPRPSSGTWRAIYAVKVLLFGPGQAR